MKCYLVGGCVRDSLLGVESKDRDWVVVGSTSEQMRSWGFKRVGADFPVFLHPETGEEYALARTERKSGAGHKGFDVSFGPEVTLEEDLRRRDLTINAMAIDPDDGQLIDPFWGEDDLDVGVLRHVNDEAFADDPLRVLRVARFAARFGFSVDRDTTVLMTRAAAELSLLTVERVWKETVRALAEAWPAEFFRVLSSCGALEAVFPEIHNLINVPQRKEFHREDAFDHTMSVLSKCSGDPLLGWAAVCHDLGKGETRPDEWPRHIGHEHRGEKIAGWLCGRLKVPNKYTELALLAARYHMKVHRIEDMKPGGVVRLLLDTDAFRRRDRFRRMVEVCRADHDSHANPDPRYRAGEMALAALDAAAAVRYADLNVSTNDPEIIRDILRHRRVEAVRSALRASS